MIELDEDQDRTLRDVSEIIGRAAARRHLEKSRKLARLMLTFWSVLRPGHFQKWNEARMRPEGER